MCARHMPKPISPLPSPFPGAADDVCRSGCPLVSQRTGVPMNAVNPRPDRKTSDLPAVIYAVEVTEVRICGKTNSDDFSLVVPLLRLEPLSRTRQGVALAKRLRTSADWTGFLGQPE